VLALWAVVVVLLAARALWRGLAPPGPAVTVQLRQLDVNRASVDELQALPGVGPGRAEAIVLERIRRGPFEVVDDLLRVDGLGPDLLRRLRPFVRV
jgi:competence ComEA-like helix-hairpin-helix protein